MCLEDPRKHARKRQHTIAGVGLWLAALKPSILALQRAGYGESLPGEIDIFPAQTQHLATSQPQRECDPIEHFKPMTLYDIQEQPRLALVERLNFVFWNAWCLGELRDVARNIVPLHRLIERPR